MNDRELLELAAKAADLGAVLVNTEYEHCFKVPYSIRGINGWKEWNPLTDDGDALRLAVKLNMHLHIDFDRPERLDVRAYIEGADAKETSNDPYAATRRAIVRAAAELAHSDERQIGNMQGEK